MIYLGNIPQSTKESIYALAVDNGYTGTLAEFLSALSKLGVIDTSPTAGSLNPVTSNGVRKALDNIQSTSIEIAKTEAKSYAYSKAQTDTLISGFKNITSSTINIPVATWDATNLNCTVSASGVTADNAAVVTPDPASMDVYSEAGIVCTAQAAGTLTFTCKTVPTAAVAVNIMVVG